MRIAYLFSRYPVVSQTFVDTEMLALERAGVELEIFSIYPPHTSFRHGHALRLKAPIHYAPPQSILKAGEEEARRTRRWPTELIAAHDRKYGPQYKATVRARNALYFADLLRARGFTHFHVHFANRAAHTAVFLKAISGLPFSMSTHGQDYMVDLGNHELLAEICHEATFIANETEWSTGELRKLCPGSAEKMLRVFNGMDLSNFPPMPPPSAPAQLPRIVSTGRLIEFKGFHHLIAAAANLRDAGLQFQCDIIGEGPWRERLQQAIDAANLASCVRLTGAFPQEEVFRALRECDIFTLPCVVDAAGASDVFPTVILEAMATGKPVVSTRIAGVPEQIVHEETGYICKPGSVEELTTALGKLIRSPELRRQLGENARRRLVAEFNVDHTVKALAARFQKHVQPDHPPAPRKADLAILVHDWPAPGRLERDIQELTRSFPALRAWAFHATHDAPASENADLLRHCDFLPDGMILEGEWQQQKELRHRIETWRGELPGKLPTEEFLRHARYALSLRGWVARDGIRHIHAPGPRELVTAWLLRKLTGVTITGEFDAVTSASLLAAMAPEFSAFRATARRKDDPLAKLTGERRPVIIHQRSARSLDPEWLQLIRRYATGSDGQ